MDNEFNGPINIIMRLVYLFLSSIFKKNIFFICLVPDLFHWVQIPNIVLFDCYLRGVGFFCQWFGVRQVIDTYLSQHQLSFEVACKYVRPRWPQGQTWPPLSIKLFLLPTIAYSHRLCACKMILLSNFYNRNRKSYKNWPISFQILKYCDLHVFISQHSFYRITAQTFVSLNQCKKKSKYKNKYFFELGNIFPVSWLLFYNCFFTICFASSNIYKICWTMFNLSTFLRAVTRSTLRLSGLHMQTIKV